MKKTLLLCVLLFSACLPVAAVDFPAAVDEYVNDFANVISDADAKRIRDLLGNIESQTGIEITVTTIESLAEYQAGTSLRSFAAQLFDSWGVGDSQRNDGIMILFSNKDREVWIEAGLGYNHKYNAEFQKVVDENMLPYFRDEEYSRGLYEGAVGVTQVVTRQVSWFSYYQWPIILSALAAVCVFAGISCIRSGKKGWGYGFFALAGVLLLFVLKLVLSSKGGKKGGFGGGRSGGGGAGGKW